MTGRANAAADPSPRATAEASPSAAAAASPSAAPGPEPVRVSLVNPLAGGPDPIVVAPGAAELTVDGTVPSPTLWRQDAERATLRDQATGATHRLLLLTSDATTPAMSLSSVVRSEVVIDGWRFEVELESAARAALQDRARRGRAEVGQSGPAKVHAIIPGVVVSVSVAPGDTVVAGQQLVVVEAMKMQNELRAPRGGTIEHVAASAGSRIDVGDLLVVIS